MYKEEEVTKLNSQPVSEAVKASRAEAVRSLKPAGVEVPSDFCTQ